MTTVSVVIPTYNREETIRRAVASALNQTLDDIEVIVVDDGSTDDTIAVLDEIEDHRLTVIEHIENRGGSAARNTGIEHCSGEYIAFLDSDDEWLPKKLELQKARLETLGDDWVGVYCNFIQKRENSVVELLDNLIRRPTGLEGSEKLIVGILLRNFAPRGGSTLFLKSQVVCKVDGFDESFQRHQDLEFLVRILQQGKLGFVDEKLVRLYDTGYPSSKDAKQVRDQFVSKYESLIESMCLESDIERIQSFNMAKYYFSEGHYRLGIKKLRKGKSSHYKDWLGLGYALVRGFKNNLEKSTLFST